MASNRVRALAALGLVGIGLAAGGCSSSQQASTNRTDTLVINGGRHDRGLAAQADRVAQNILTETGGPAIVIVPSDE